LKKEGKRKHTKLGIVTLVKESLSSHALHDDIPRVDGTRGSHESGEDGVGGEDGATVLHGELTDDGVICGCNLFKIYLNNNIHEVEMR
jgi:hypothetical protein